MKSIKVNPQVLAKQICQEFPEISHAKVLDLIAKSAGYTGFRAMKSCLPAIEGIEELVHRERAKAMRYAAEIIELYDDATMRGDHMLDSTECAGVIDALAEREIELADAARTKELQAFAKKSKTKGKSDDGWETHMFTLPMRAWDAAGLTDKEADAQLPAFKRVKYQAEVKVYGGFGERSSPSLSIDIVPMGESSQDFKPTDRLSITVEINEGVPCAHLTNDATGEMLTTTFGTRDGLFLREAEGELVHIKRSEPLLHEQVFSRLKKSHGKLGHAWFVSNNLSEIWEVDPVSPPSEDNGPYYVWANDSCDNKCNTLDEAIEIAKEFLQEDPESDPYITDIDNEFVMGFSKADSNTAA